MRSGWLVPAMAVFLAGYYLFPGAWWHGLWLWGMLLPCWCWHRWRVGGGSGGVMGAAATWLGVYFLLAVVQHPPGLEVAARLRMVEAVAGLAGVLTLVAAMAASVQTAHGLRTCQRWCVAAAVVAAVTSVVVFYGLTPGVGFGERLCNVFVHGGQHPVPTAITFGFAAVWAGLGLAASSSHRTAWGWGTVLFLLNLAVAFCQSRGASLALLVATIFLAVLVRRKRAALPLVWVVLALVSFHFLSRHLAVRAARAEADGAVAVPGQAVPRRLPENGLGRWVERGDAGRLDLYRLLLRRIDEPSQRFWGKGWWHEHSGAAELRWPATHPHSVLMATHYHGGQVVLVGLFFFGALVLSRAFEVWRGGLGLEGMVLFVYGSTALVFDGEALTTVFTEPRFESLVFWVPVGLIAGRYGAMQAGLVGLASGRETVRTDVKAPAGETVAAASVVS